MEAHAGAIWLESARGDGTTFTLLFPEQARLVVGADLPDRCVLVADDDARVREVARRMLEHHGFGVVEAIDGGEAVTAFRAHRDRVCAALLDLSMPVMGGEEAARVLRILDEALPILVMSGYPAQSVVERLGTDRVSAILTKPFDASTLLRHLRAALDEPSGERLVSA